MKWRKELKPRRVFNLVKLGFLNYLQWPLGAISYFIIIYGLGLKYVFPALTFVEGAGIFGAGIFVSYVVGLMMKNQHKMGGLWQDEQAMATEANPFAKLNYQITLIGMDLTIETTEASMRWMEKEGIPTDKIQTELGPYREYRKTVRELLQQWS